VGAGSLIVTSFVLAAFGIQAPQLWIAAGLMIVLGQVLVLVDVGGAQAYRQKRWEKNRAKARQKGAHDRSPPGAGASLTVAAGGVMVFALGLIGTLS
jgi:hypothetical protein